MKRVSSGENSRHNEEILRSSCSSALDRLACGYEIRYHRGAFPLYGRVVSSSLLLVIWVEARVSRELVGVFGEVFIEGEFDFGLLQSIITATIVSPISKTARVCARVGSGSYSLKSTWSHSSMSSALRIFCSQLDTPDMVKNAKDSGRLRDLNDVVWLKLWVVVVMRNVDVSKQEELCVRKCGGRELHNWGLGMSTTRLENQWGHAIGCKQCSLFVIQIYGIHIFIFS